MSKESLVAYFDILGYQSFLKSNSALETAEKVFEVVKNAPNEAVNHWAKPYENKPESDWHAIIKSIRSLVFSDTIVVSCPLTSGKPDELHVALIAGISGFITSTMFKKGLPVRGAITLGSFVFDDTCIAGRAVVDAHTLCQRLDLAGTAFAPELSKYIDTNFKKHRVDVWDKNYPYYLIPLRDQSELKTRLITWNTSVEAGNFTGVVRDSFWSWNKDIPLSVDSKVHNTAKMLDFFRMHDQKTSEKKS